MIIVVSGIALLLFNALVFSKMGKPRNSAPAVTSTYSGHSDDNYPSDGATASQRFKKNKKKVLAQPSYYEHYGQQLYPYDYYDQSDYFGQKYW